MGLSPKYTAGKATDRLALKVYVDEKRPISALPHDQIVPESLDLPTIDAPIATDVEAIGKQTLELFAGRNRPLRPAFSIGVVDHATGTLGCIVRRRADGAKLFVLSNSHILAKSGTAPLRSPIIQPGPDDGGTANDVVALLEQSVSFAFDGGTANLCDAAIAEIIDGVSVVPTLPEIGTIKGVNPTLARGMAVKKSGRTTGFSTSVIKDLDYQTFMSYPDADGVMRSAGFRSQVLCERYSDGGDSGALVCDADGMAVGLHWCGSLTASVFSPINFVLDALQIDIVTSV
jgi:hypothetical protein